MELSRFCIWETRLRSLATTFEVAKEIEEDPEELLDSEGLPEPKEPDDESWPPDVEGEAAEEGWSALAAVLAAALDVEGEVAEEDPPDNG